MSPFQTKLSKSLFIGDCHAASRLPVRFIEAQSGGRTKGRGSGKVRQVQGIQGNRRCVSNWRPRHSTRRLGKPNWLPELPASLGAGLIDFLLEHAIYWSPLV